MESTIVVSAPLEASAATGVNGNQASNASPDSGAVYVCREQQNGTYVQEAYLKASNTGVGDRFGSSIAVSGDGSTIIVGAPGEASNATTANGNGADNSALAAGAAYVFTSATRSGAAFLFSGDGSGRSMTMQRYIKAPNTDGGDQFGIALSMDRDAGALLIGVPSEQSSFAGDPEDDVTTGAGAVYLY